MADEIRQVHPAAAYEIREDDQEREETHLWILLAVLLLRLKRKEREGR